MGRVDEAMRRAEERRLTNGRTMPSDTPSPHPAEVFPVEIGDNRKLRSVSPVDDAAAAVAPLAHAAGLPESKRSLFDRLDARLSRKTVIDNQIDPVSREQYRRLAASLHAMQAESGLKVVMVASALANEGKTLTATNLALTLSESYHRDVLLIDGDLRKPSLDAVFGLNGEPGLAEGLSLVEERKLPIQRISAHLTVLTAGRPNSDPMGALASDRARRLIAEARDAFDWVIIDTPPIGLLSDASLLAAAADGTLLVVKAESTPYELVERALAALGRDRVLGVVLNRVTSRVAGLDHKYYGGYYSGHHSPSSLRG